MSHKSVSAESMLFNVGAETGVLGGLMLDNDSWDEIAPLLNSGDFYYGQHQTIFREIERLVSAGLPIDLITLSESMERKDLLERCGGFAYLAELSKNTPSAANIVAYAEIVREYPQLHSKLPRSAFPWSQSRDDGYANTGQGGYPTCSEWWSQNKTGLKSRVLDTVNTTTMTRMAAAFTLYQCIKRPRCCGRKMLFQRQTTLLHPALRK